MMRNPSIVLAAALVVALAGCTPTSSSTTANTPGTGMSGPPGTAAPSSPAATVELPNPGGNAGPAAPATTSPPAAGVPAEQSNPPGISPLTDEEAQEAELKCTRLGRAIEPAVKAARKAGKTPYEAVLEALKNPPSVAGMDVPRCAELMRRDVVASQALNIESEAKNNLKAISVGLATATNRTPPEFCASAPPVPASLDKVKNGPWQSEATSWDAPGWKCTGFNLRGAPQYFQYELKTDAAKQTWEVIARGFPVAGQPATELYLSGTAENGKIRPSSQVMRR